MKKQKSKGGNSVNTVPELKALKKDVWENLENSAVIDTKLKLKIKNYIDEKLNFPLSSEEKLKRLYPERWTMRLKYLQALFNTTKVEELKFLMRKLKSNYKALKDALEESLHKEN